MKWNRINGYDEEEEDAGSVLERVGRKKNSLETFSTDDEIICARSPLHFSWPRALFRAAERPSEKSRKARECRFTRAKAEFTLDSSRLRFPALSRCPLEDSRFSPAEKPKGEREEKRKKERKEGGKACRQFIPLFIAQR